ncbi:response regulator [Paenibacillus sp. N1-5-1-14]|uniref:response regulator transcription factor n=1 Tax=Paenibacillus radicibacter TaxID=2972488 RepID=UPI002158B77E|nr:response regulator [Paenibacillus radicibacter]MCR8643062.1 response regulator [Paenibacillus radicibacter]
MYKMLIVEDEHIVKVALKSLINWNDYGFDYTYEASNGKQGLDILQQHPDIDVVITDINMPIMDGLQMIKEIRQLGLSPQIIILSAYDDYALVRQALKLQTSDYMLKNEMDPEHMIALLQDIKAKLDVSKEKRHETDKNGPQVITTRVSKVQLLKKITTAKWSEELYEKVEDQELRITSRNLAVCYLWIDDYELITDKYDESQQRTFETTALNVMYQCLDEANMGEAYHLTKQQYVCMLSLPNSGYSQLRLTLTELLSQIFSNLKHYMNISVSIGISDVRSGFDQIHPLFTQAQKNASFRFILGKSKLIFPEHAKAFVGSTGARLTGKEAAYIQALKDSNKEKAMQELDQLFAIIMQGMPDQLDEWYSQYRELQFIVMRFLYDLGVEAEELNREAKQLYYSMTKLETCEEIHAAMRLMTEQIVQYMKSHKDSTLISAVNRAQQFIRTNYCEDLTLKMVSDFVELSESHFSHLFSKETGGTFTDFLTKTRVERAKELIATTNMKVYEIAEKVGYTNTEHFSRVFKKVTGYSPAHFKHQESISAIQ